MKAASIFDLRDNLSSYITDVSENNNTIIIYRYNKPVAKLTALTASDKEYSIDSYYGFMGPSEKKGVEVEDSLRRSDDEKKRSDQLREHK